MPSAAGVLFQIPEIGDVPHVPKGRHSVHVKRHFLEAQKASEWDKCDTRRMCSQEVKRETWEGPFLPLKWHLGFAEWDWTNFVWSFVLTGIEGAVRTIRN